MLATLFSPSLFFVIVLLRLLLELCGLVIERHESQQQIVCCEKLVKPVHCSTAILTSGFANAGSTIIRR